MRFVVPGAKSAASARWPAPSLATRLRPSRRHDGMNHLAESGGAPAAISFESRHLAIISAVYGLGF